MATGSTLEAIVLAAGLGSRFGGGKLTAPWRGRMLIEGALAAAVAAPVWSVTVVWGADDAVPAAATAFFEGRGEALRLKLVHAERYVRGLSASLRAGIESLPAGCAGAYLFLGDMPRIPAGVLEPLAEALAAGALAAAPTFDGRRGHPVLFSRALFGDLLRLEGDKGAGSLLADLPPGQLALVPAPDDGVLCDVDLPSEADR